MDRASVDRAACLAGVRPSPPNWRICASLQRRYLCKTSKIFGLEHFLDPAALWRLLAGGIA